MSQQLISRSPDVKRLRDEGFSVSARAGFLVVSDVPYVTASREVRRGSLACALCLAGDVTARPDDHTMYWSGDYPCSAEGIPIEAIRNSSESRTLAENVHVNHRFSAKPKPNDAYGDYHEKVTTYVAILSNPARAIDAAITAQIFPVVAPDKDEMSVFRYIDTASSRAEIDAVTAKLAVPSAAIVGLGGTGSYVLDLVAKTPVRQIHLFDGDLYLQHNAFRAPGATSIEELTARVHKVTYLASIYSKMRTGVIAHPEYVDERNVGELQGMSIVFICMDAGPSKRLIIERLEADNVRFIDVGMGVTLTDNELGGILRVTTSTPGRREHARRRVSFGTSSSENDEYDRNIQVADLNALNAALAVFQWKKLCGFYRDLVRAHNMTLTLDGTLLMNEDQ